MELIPQTRAVVEVVLALEDVPHGSQMLHILHPAAVQALMVMLEEMATQLAQVETLVEHVV